MISARRAKLLGDLLDPYVAGFDGERRIAHDPVEAPRLYRDPADQEIAGLLASSLAYGRVELFKPKVLRLLREMGPSPAAYVRTFDPGRDGPALSWFTYRFHRPADIAALFAGMADVLEEHGSLGAFFAEEVERGGSLQQGLAAFTRRIRAVGEARIAPAMETPAGLAHLLPDPLLGGASKRLLLYLRWMVRRDEVDLGTWEGRLPRSALLIPLDTHVIRISQLLGLTKRKSPSWSMAEEITASLRRLDPVDPIRYDFALCHLGMSGACPAKRSAPHCEACPLLGACAPGRRKVAVRAH